jgi:glycosyltransferase involved in cell wall biosynthesis
MYIKYCGPAHDYSGYGEAVRHDIGALHSVNIPLITEIPRFCLELSDYGKWGKVAGDAVNNVGEYKAKILHLTPNMFVHKKEEGKINIARVFWETSKLSYDFAQGCKEVDEIWTGSKFNEDAIRASGVDVPIKIIPEAIDMVDRESIEPFEITYKDDYKFYSIFEWTTRKNPKALLEAFWLEFENTEGVSLSIKTFLDNFTFEKQKHILDEIQSVKNRLGLKKYAPIYIFNGLLNRNQMYKFHQTFDCFVSTHRGEGWGIPQMEALIMGKPVISTNLGGIHEWLVDKADAFLLPYTLIPVNNSRSPEWYTNDQQWGDVKVDDIRKALRFVFDNQKEAESVGNNGRQIVEGLFNLEKVGGLMRVRLDELKAL